MSKGNLFLGMGRGSVGDVTFYRNYGQQCARARNRNPRNPKTDAQVIQRMILATASKAYGRMKSIVNHSFEGIEYGAKSQSYFLSKALETIRAYVSANYPTQTNQTAVQAVGLAQPSELLANAQYGAGLLVSRGSLPSIEYQAETTGDDTGMLLGFGKFVAAGSAPTVAEILASIGAVPGDQITVCGFRQLDGVWVESRYVIDGAATDTQLAAAWDPTGAAACFDQTKTQVGSLQLQVNGDMFITNVPMWAWTVILSRKSGTTWLRSTQYLIYASDMSDLWQAEVVVPLWLAGTANIESVNPYFLNQAESGE